MIPPLLKLAFVQGPREGDSLEYKPGSTIRIGRIVRGNEIAIKDAGISTKHLRIVSDCENWIIHDLGSSNGTILNSDTLDPDTPVNLRHGDVIKLGEYTSIVVNFETDVQAQEHKLPPRPRRNNRRLAVADPDPIPIESVQEKPTRKGRSSKQDEHELPKKVAITKEEEAPVEKKANSRARRGKNTESVQNLGLNSIKLEVEDTPKGLGISAMKGATRRQQIENACLGQENVKSEDTAVEEKDEKRTSRATRSKKKEIGGGSFLELEMVLNQARRGRAKKKKMEQEPSKSVEMEVRNNDVEAAEKDSSDKEEDETSKRVEQVEIELRKSTLGEEDGERENLQDTIDDVERVEVDLGKMTLGEWFKLMEVNLRKQIVEETEKMIEPMRSKSLRVHKHIAEQSETGV